MAADLSAGGWKGDPKAFSGGVGELLQEQKHAEHDAGTACDLQCVTSSTVSLIPLLNAVTRAAQMFSIS